MYLERPGNLLGHVRARHFVSGSAIRGESISFRSLCHLVLVFRDLHQHLDGRMLELRKDAYKGFLPSTATRARRNHFIVLCLELSEANCQFAGLDRA